MKKTRSNVFETNSSSVHAICITKNDRVLNELTQYVRFRFDDFGWEFRDLRSLHEKASYLYTAILCNYDTKEESDKFIEKIKSALTKNGVTYDFDEPEFEIFNYATENGGQETRRWLASGYVDHPQDLIYFIDDVCNDENKLMKYLFSSQSCVITANDNSDNYGRFLDENTPEYEHDLYEKGN